MILPTAGAVEDKAIDVSKEEKVVATRHRPSAPSVPVS